MKELKARGPVQPSTPLDRALIPDAVLKDPSLSAGARLLWVLLAEYQGKSLECFPFEATLDGSLGVKTRQRQGYVKELKNYTRGDPPKPFPLVEVTRVWAEKGGKTGNIYRLLWQPFLAATGKPNTATETQSANGGDVQYSAHRSGGDTQETVVEGSEVPHEDDSALPDGTPQGDTQSPAHRSGSESGAEEASLSDGSDAQYSAHPSGGSPQCTDAAAFPHEGACAIKDSLPPGDAQSFTHRSAADTQNTADGQAAIPSEDADAGPGSAPPGDTQSSGQRSGTETLNSPAAPSAFLGGDGGSVLDGVPPGDVQSFAHLFGDDMEDTAERPVIPMEHGVATLAGKPQGDVQSSAHWSGNDARDTAAERDEMRSGDSGAGSQGRPDWRWESPHQGDEIPETPPAARAGAALAPVFDRSAFRPLGAGDCMLHRLASRCKRCGATVNPGHLMIRVIDGTYCERCCPACHPTG